MSEYLVRLRGDHLHPDYQNGDILTVRDAAQAEPGQLVVVVNGGNIARVHYYTPQDEGTVIGIVTGMNRRIPGAAS